MDSPPKPQLEWLEYNITVKRNMLNDDGPTIEFSLLSSSKKFLEKIEMIYWNKEIQHEFHYHTKQYPNIATVNDTSFRGTKKFFPNRERLVWWQSPTYGEEKLKPDCCGASKQYRTFQIEARLQKFTFLMVFLESWPDKDSWEGKGIIRFPMWDYPPKDTILNALVPTILMLRPRGEAPGCLVLRRSRFGRS
ncbi:hypothetical protein K438DRAFT_1766252 [Mycena galopus ATCC 62051]|nr:hypothetical protein K438DRAFT_1766252 [Mycena galopus ATCC 62051]